MDDLAVELAAWDALSDEALLLTETMLMSEPVLSREWDTPEEDTAWACLGDIELDSPNWLGESFAELEARGFRRINDPRKNAKALNTPLSPGTTQETASTDNAVAA